MSNYDKVTFEGNIGRDATMAFTPDGTPYTRFSVCCNRKFTKRNGEEVSEKKWYSCVVFGEGRAQFADQFKKGDRLVVFEGHLEADPQTGGPRIWYSQDGSPHASFSVIIHEMRWYPKDGSKNTESVEKEPEGLIEDGHPQPEAGSAGIATPATLLPPTAAPADADPLADYQSLGSAAAVA